MNRYFVELAYDGSAYSGWQIQPDSPTIQELLQEKMSLQWNEEIGLTGCGRTDAGVHARGYFAHFETEKILMGDHLFKLNTFLPEDIVVHRFVKMEDSAHARYDAIRRRYRYFIHFNKSVFKRKYSYYLPVKRNYDLNKFNLLANLLREYMDFQPFCKVNSDVNSFRCKISTIYWEIDREAQTATLTVESNRFLHGMIRLLVGCTLYVAAGRMSLHDVRKSMETQTPLSMPFSAPAHGLFLDHITYPYISSSPNYASIFPAFANK